MARTRQTPLRTGYGPQTTAREVITDRQLAGTVAVVTGGYVGVGLETTRALTSAGATVIVPARSVEKARASLAGLDRAQSQLHIMRPPK